MIDGRVFKLRKQLSDKISHNWTVEEMARGFDLSVPHFQKLFKSQTGTPPMSFLRDLRLEKAADLLTSTYNPIKQIGVQTGLTNESHFTRDFKKRYSMTPTEYRKYSWEIEQSTPPDGQEG